MASLGEFETERAGYRIGFGQPQGQALTDTVGFATLLTDELPSFDRDRMCRDFVGFPVFSSFPKARPFRFGLKFYGNRRMRACFSAAKS